MDEEGISPVEVSVNLNNFSPTLYVLVGIVKIPTTSPDLVVVNLPIEYDPIEIFSIPVVLQNNEFDPNAITDVPDGFKRLSYQIDAVNEGFKLLQKHNGFFLADVVGLGKTVVGTLIAKKFFYSNDFPNHITNTLIVVPPALKDNWVETLDKFQLQNYAIVTNGSLHKITDADKYDLILIDEAHKFRNDTADAYNDLQKICKTRTRRRLKDGSYANKKVILISATPLNNRPQDIANQIYLFQENLNQLISFDDTKFVTKLINRIIQDFEYRQSGSL